MSLKWKDKIIELFNYYKWTQHRDKLVLCYRYLLPSCNNGRKEIVHYLDIQFAESCTNIYDIPPESGIDGVGWCEYILYANENVEIYETAMESFYLCTENYNSLQLVMLFVLELLNYRPRCLIFPFANTCDTDKFNELIKVLPDAHRKCLLKCPMTEVPFIDPTRPNYTHMITFTMALTTLDSFYKFLLCLKQCNNNNVICDDIIRKIHWHTFNTH